MSSIPSPGTTRWLSGPEERTWHDFMLMNMQLTAVIGRDLFNNSGLSAQDYGVLVPLNADPSTSMRILQLARELGWEKSRLSHHLSRMSQRGLVCKGLSPQDARGATVTITEAGTAALEAAAPRHVAMVREFFIDLINNEQLDALAQISTRVLDNLAALPEG